MHCCIVQRPDFWEGLREADWGCCEHGGGAVPPPLGEEAPQNLMGGGVKSKHGGSMGEA